MIDPEIIIGATTGGGFAAIAAWKLLDFAINAYKSNSTIINNDLKHVSDSLTTLVSTHRELISKHDHVEKCIEQNTEALKIQSVTNEHVTAAVKDLSIMIQNKL